MRVYIIFFRSFVILERRIETKENWLYLIANLIHFFQGGLNYECAKRMGLSELIDLEKQARKINQEINKK
jgi:hypothetical protein